VIAVAIGRLKQRSYSRAMILGSDIATLCILRVAVVQCTTYSVCDKNRSVGCAPHTDLL
jgi:hypothetical protein